MIALAALHARTVSMTVEQSPRQDGIVTPDAVGSVVMEVLDWLEHGVMLVDEGARVYFASSAARHFFDSGRLYIRDRHLRAGSAAETAELHRLIIECVRQRPRAGFASQAAFFHFGEPPLLVQLLPLRPRTGGIHGLSAPFVIMFITDPAQVDPPSSQHLCVQFGLTATQAIFAREIAKGENLRECARRLGISEPTARTHMRHILQKTGTRRQAELMRVIFASRLAVRQPRG